MSKKEFIDKYGDPFIESVNLLEIPDSEILPTLEEGSAEESELESFEKKYNFNLKTK